MSDTAGKPEDEVLKLPDRVVVLDADAKLQDLITHFHRMRWVAVMMITLLLVAGLCALTLIVWDQQRQLSIERRQLVASCGFFTDLAGLPIVPVPPAKRPPVTSVTIIADARYAAAGLGCHLPAASPSLLKWAGYYNIPVAEGRPRWLP